MIQGGYVSFLPISCPHLAQLAAEWALLIVHHFMTEELPCPLEGLGTNGALEWLLVYDHLPDLKVLPLSTAALQTLLRARQEAHSTCGRHQLGRGIHAVLIYQLHKVIRASSF